MIYLNNASTTKPDISALNNARSILYSCWGNPSDNNSFGENSLKMITKARKAIAKTIDAEEDEIYFTSGATEANNWFLHKTKLNVQCSTIEHPSNRNLFNSQIQVKSDGIIDESTISSKFDAISVLYTNNEIGVKQDIKKLSKIAHKNGMIFYTDATQAYGHERISVKDSEIDVLCCSAHKFGGLKGVGFIYVNNKIKNDLPVMQLGGHQENGFRAGTENVFGIYQMMWAAKNRYKYIYEHELAIKILRNEFIKKLSKVTEFTINGSTIDCCNGILNIQFKNIKGEELREFLAMKKIYCSSGSACNSKNNKVSYVLTSIGLNDNQARSSLRFSFDYDNTLQEVDKTVETIKFFLSLKE